MADTLTIDDSILNTDVISSHVPDGIYLLAIKGCKSDIVSWPDDARLKWTFGIKDGPVGHGTLTMITTFKKDAQFSAGRLLNAVDYDVAGKLHGKELTQAKFEAMAEGLTKSVSNKEIAALVGETASKKNGKFYSNIEEIYPASEFAEQAAAASSRPVRTAAAKDPEEPVEDLAASIGEIW